MIELYRFGILFALAGCAAAVETGEKGKTMRDKLETILSTHADIYVSPKEDRIASLQDAFSALDYDGLWLGAPDSVDPALPGIPTVTLAGNTLLRAWEVNSSNNAVIVVVDCDRGITRTWPVHQPPAKKLKPRPKPAKPVGEAAEATEAGAFYNQAGNSVAGGLPPGEYALSVVEWDRTSNIRKTRRLPKQGETSVQPRTPAWPYAVWEANPAAYQARPESPVLSEPAGIGLAISGIDEKAEILGSVAVKARAIHFPPPDGKTTAAMNIRAGVPVDLLQFTKDRTMPERVTVVVPIQGPSAARPSDTLKGWFALPLSRLRRDEETQVYAFMDGYRAGPIRVPALKP